ncbi:MAG: macro domain-containing protein [Cetobacterium sp.]|uniref:macro domain-containing protein n=1 Tax=Cetobacterium sp. TaxID=2071632 RepID=UPI003F3B94C9
MNKRTLNINGSKVIIKVGDIFTEEGLKTIAFNEYFDTIVDNEIISEASLNGKFIKKGYYDPQKYGISPNDLNDILLSNRNISDYKRNFNHKRDRGNKQKFLLGTSIVYENYLITAMTKFDHKNRAYLTQKDFIDFLINFWDQVDTLYNGRTVIIPLLGSGITRFYEKIDIPDQELLNIIIWTFKISRKKFAYNSKLVIVIHYSKQDYINFYKLKRLERI